MLEAIRPQEVVLLERSQEDHVRKQKSKEKEGQLFLLLWCQPLSPVTRPVISCAPHLLLAD